MFICDLSQEVEFYKQQCKYDNKTSISFDFGTMYSYDIFQLENVSINKKISLVINIV